jgi:hypothetical protein
MKRSRKGDHRQHLPKVGTLDEAREEQHLEREAIADVMGLGGVAPWIKWAVLAIVAVAFAVSLVTWIFLI